MKVFINSDFRCFTKREEGLTPVESDFFDGKCQTFIEGYRFVPEGRTWTREDGTTFTGEMISPAVPVEPLLISQAEYERTRASMTEAYQKGVNSV